MRVLISYYIWSFGAREFSIIVDLLLCFHYDWHLITLLILFLYQNMKECNCTTVVIVFFFFFLFEFWLSFSYKISDIISEHHVLSQMVALSYDLVRYLFFFFISGRVRYKFASFWNRNHAFRNLQRGAKNFHEMLETEKKVTALT